MVLATSVSQDEKWDARLAHDPIHDNAYYGKCMLGGVISCGLTHWAVTPLDVAKCNMQFDPVKYKNLLGERMALAGFRFLVRKCAARATLLKSPLVIELVVIYG